MRGRAINSSSDHTVAINIPAAHKTAHIWIKGWYKSNIQYGEFNYNTAKKYFQTQITNTQH